MGHIHREGCGGIIDFKMATIPPSTTSLLATCDRKARRIIHDLRASLSSLESIISSSTSSSDPSVASEHDQHLQTLRNGLADLASIGAEMDSLLSVRTGRGREPENVLELWRRKRAGLNDEMESVRIALVNIERRETRRRAEEEARMELFKRCHTSEGDAAVHLTIRDDVAAAQSARRSRKEADDMIAQGAAILRSMNVQREKFSSALNKTMSTLSTIGLSRSLLRVIDRRHRGDQYLVYGLMLVTVIVLGLLVYFVL